MKKISSIIFIGLVTLGASCKKYLDINTNPNSAGTDNVTPKVLLSGGLVTTAGNVNSFNTYGAQIGGYMANAGGYGGFGVSFTYNYGTGDFNGLWNSTYDNLEDYQFILNMTSGDAVNSYFNAAARIMKAYNFSLLVDTYNDLPYYQALKGDTVLTPSYDKAETVYAELARQLDTAIITIDNAPVTAIALSNADVMFAGNMVRWKQFANTIKLRLMVRGNGKVTFTNTSFSSDGFLTTDALVDPNYVRDNGKQNPKWSTWAFSYTGTSGNKSWMPSTWILSFYNGVKLDDPGRGAAIYYKFPSTPTNQLGNEGTGIESAPDGNFWYPAVKLTNSAGDVIYDHRIGSSAGDTTGVLKGPDAGMPIITAAESYFLQAEAVVRGILTSGDAKSLFENGVTQSFHYLYELPDNSTVRGNPTTDAQSYMYTANVSEPLANWDAAAAGGTEKEIEAIITQKYIAMNMVNADQAWNDYRRTGYPTVSTSPSATGTQSFASKVSESSRADRLPSRVLYPTSEGSYNTANVPKGISPFTSLIFWAK